MNGIRSYTCILKPKIPLNVYQNRILDKNVIHNFNCYCAIKSKPDEYGTSYIFTSGSSVGTIYGSYFKSEIKLGTRGLIRNFWTIVQS